MSYCPCQDRLGQHCQQCVKDRIAMGIQGDDECAECGALRVSHPAFGCDTFKSMLDIRIAKRKPCGCIVPKKEKK